MAEIRIDNLHSLEDGPRLRYLWDKGMRKLGVRQHLSHVVRVAKCHGAQIVHSHWGDVGWRDREAAARARARHIVTFYGKDVNYLPQRDGWRARYQELFRSVDLVLCEGPHMGACIAKLGCPSEKMLVHHLGVELDKLRFRPRKWHPGEPLGVLIAASFREKKGIPYALEALGLLQQEVPVKVTIIGDASDDPRSHPEKARILEAVERCDLRDHTRMRGYQPHSVLRDEAYRHHVFLAPSVTATDGDTEGGAPVTIIEMAATGMPVVSTRHCDIPSVVIDGETGLLAPERDAEALAEHLRSLVAHPEHWERMALAARRHVESQYDVRLQATRLAKIYVALADEMVPTMAETSQAATAVGGP